MGNDLIIINISNKEITNELLNKIIELKKSHWNHDFDSQLKWLKNNLVEDDRHILILDENNALVAYMNMINLLITNNIGNTEEMFGIGNVCVCNTYKNKGLGTVLMSVCSFYLNLYNKNGILLCKESLKNFYLKNNWKNFSFLYTIKNELQENNLLFFRDSSFFDGKIDINRNF